MSEQKQRAPHPPRGTKPGAGGGGGGRGKKPKQKHKTVPKHKRKLHSAAAAQAAGGKSKGNGNANAPNAKKHMNGATGAGGAGKAKKKFKKKQKKPKLAAFESAPIAPSVSAMTERAQVRKRMQRIGDAAQAATRAVYGTATTGEGDEDEGLLGFLHLLPQPNDLRTKAVERMLAFMDDVCIAETYAANASTEPLLRLESNAHVQRTVSEYTSIPAYVSVQLLTARYEELRELFLFYRILFDADHLQLRNAAHNQASNKERDTRSAFRNYVPACKLSPGVRPTLKQGFPEFVIDFATTAASCALGDVGVQSVLDGFPRLDGRVVALLCTRKGDTSRPTSTRANPQVPDFIVYGYVNRISQGRAGGSHKVSIGFPAGNCVRMLLDARPSVDLIFIDALHVTFWPKMEVLAQLLPRKDRPRDCHSLLLSQLPRATHEQIMCAWLPAMVNGLGGAPTHGSHSLSSITVKSSSMHSSEKAQYASGRGEGKMTVNAASRASYAVDAFAKANTMDKSQKAAFAAVCESPIVLIQGIPGSGKTYTARLSAQFIQEQAAQSTNQSLQQQGAHNKGKSSGRRAKTVPMLIGSFKNVSTDHLCEEAHNKPHPVLRLGNQSQSAVLPQYRGTNMKPSPLMAGALSLLVQKVERALNAVMDANVLIMTCMQLRTCTAEMPAQFKAVSHLLKMVLTGELVGLLQSVEKEVTQVFGYGASGMRLVEGDIFSISGQKAADALCRSLIDRTRDESFTPGLWALFQSSFNRQDTGNELSAFFSQVQKVVHAARQAGGDSDDEEDDEEDNGSSDDDDDGSSDSSEGDSSDSDAYDAAEEEDVRQREAGNQEADELRAMHQARYGGDVAATLDLTGAVDDDAFDASEVKVDPGLTFDADRSFAALAGYLTSSTRPAPREVHEMFLVLVVDTLDALRPVYQTLRDMQQGAKISANFCTVGATTSFCQFRPDVIRALQLRLYVGEEAGEVAEYQLLCLLASLYRERWPADVDTQTGRVIPQRQQTRQQTRQQQQQKESKRGGVVHSRALVAAPSSAVEGALYERVEWPQLILLGDQQQLRPLLRAPGLQGTSHQASAFERLVNVHQGTPAKLIQHVQLQANRRSHPGIVAPFRCVYKLGIDAKVEPRQRLLFPEYLPSLVAREVMCYAAAADSSGKLSEILTKGFTPALLREPREIHRSVPREQLTALGCSTHGPYDNLLPGVKVRCGNTYHPIPGRVCIIDVDRVRDHGYELPSFREGHKGTSRFNMGTAWVGAALFDHLVHTVGVPRADISVVAPYGAAYFVDNELLQFLRLVPGSKSVRAQKDLLSVQDLRKSGGSGRGGRPPQPSEEAALEVVKQLHSLARNLNDEHLPAKMRRALLRQAESSGVGARKQRVYKDGAAAATGGTGGTADSGDGNRDSSSGDSVAVEKERIGAYFHRLITLFSYPTTCQIGDKMQGCENEIVILDLSISNPAGYNFLKDYRRLNVLMSRARSSLIILAGGRALMGNGWRGIAQHVPSGGGFSHANRGYNNGLHVLGVPGESTAGPLPFEDAEATEDVEVRPRRKQEEDTVPAAVAAAETDAVTVVVGATVARAVGDASVGVVAVEAKEVEEGAEAGSVADSELVSTAAAAEVVVQRRTYRLKTHVRVFRAFIDSAARAGFPVAVVDCFQLAFLCPRHHFIVPVDSIRKRATIQRVLTRLFTAYTPAVDRQIPNPLAQMRPEPASCCDRKCGLKCPRGHPCKHRCHVHAPYFALYGEVDETQCWDTVALPLPSCVHGTTTEVKCFDADQRERVLQSMVNMRATTLAQGPVQWPCKRAVVGACPTCKGPLAPVSCLHSIRDRSPPSDCQACCDRKAAARERAARVAEADRAEAARARARELPSDSFVTRGMRMLGLSSEPPKEQRAPEPVRFPPVVKPPVQSTVTTATTAAAVTRKHTQDRMENTATTSTVRAVTSVVTEIAPANTALAPAPPAVASKTAVVASRGVAVASRSVAPVDEAAALARQMQGLSLQSKPTSITPVAAAAAAPVMAAVPPPKPAVKHVVLQLWAVRSCVGAGQGKCAGGQDRDVHFTVPADSTALLARVEERLEGMTSVLPMRLVAGGVKTVVDGTYPACTGDLVTLARKHRADVKVAGDPQKVLSRNDDTRVWSVRRDAMRPNALAVCDNEGALEREVLEPLGIQTGVAMGAQQQQQQQQQNQKVKAKSVTGRLLHLERHRFPEFQNGEGLCVVRVVVEPTVHKGEGLRCDGCIEVLHRREELLQVLGKRINGALDRMHTAVEERCAEIREDWKRAKEEKKNRTSAAVSVQGSGLFGLHSIVHSVVPLFAGRVVALLTAHTPDLENCPVVANERAMYPWYPLQREEKKKSKGDDTASVSNDSSSGMTVEEIVTAWLRTEDPDAGDTVLSRQVELGQQGVHELACTLMSQTAANDTTLAFSGWRVNSNEARDARLNPEVDRGVDLYNLVFRSNAAPVEGEALAFEFSEKKYGHWMRLLKLLRVMVARRLHCIKSFVSLPRVLLSNPVTCVMQYPANRKAELSFMEDDNVEYDVEHSLRLTFEQHPSRRLTQHKQQVRCTVSLLVPDFAGTLSSPNGVRASKYGGPGNKRKPQRGGKFGGKGNSGYRGDDAEPVVSPEEEAVAGVRGMQEWLRGDSGKPWNPGHSEFAFVVFGRVMMSLPNKKAK